MYACLPASVNKVVTSAVQENLEPDRTSRKRRYTTTFTPEDHTSRGPNMFIHVNVVATNYAAHVTLAAGSLAHFFMRALEWVGAAVGMATFNEAKRNY